MTALDRSRNQVFVLPSRSSPEGISWLYIELGERGIVARRRGVWRSGWDMPESGTASQRMLEPREGFGQ